MHKRPRQLLVFGAAASVAALGACGGSDPVDDSIQSAHVEVALYNLQGEATGACLGVLVSPDRVLTAGHCVVSSSRWRVASPGSGMAATASRAYAYDWRKSDTSQPRLHDLAVLVLDTPIQLREYPVLATKPAREDEGALRVRRAARGLEAIAATLQSGKRLGFSLHYATKLTDGEALDTGGAIVTSDGRSVLGVVHGRGTTTGTLYATRTDGLASWLRSKITCSSSTPIATKLACDDDDEDGGSDGCRKDGGVRRVDGGSSSGSGSGGGSGSAGTRPGDGSGGSGAGGSGGSCNTGDGTCHGDCTGSGSGAGGPGGTGSAGTPTGGGSSGSGGESGAGGSVTSGSGTGSPGTPTGGGSNGTGGTSDGSGYGGAGSGSGGSSDGSGYGGAGAGGGGTSGTASPGATTGGGSGGSGGSGDGTAGSSSTIGCYAIPGCKDHVVDFGSCNCSAPYNPPPPPIK